MNARRLFFLFMLVLTSYVLCAQQGGFRFNGFAFDNNGKAMEELGITVKFTIYDYNQPSTKHEEEQQLSTDFYGAFSTIVGEGGAIDNLKFSQADFWLKVEIKKTSSTGGFTTVSNARIAPVPFAKSADNGIPIGAIMPFGAANVPNGWLLCDGSAVSRTDYADLFSRIGTSYGVGNGSTTFNLPDFRSRVSAGINTGDTDFNTLGKKGGASTHTLTEAQIASHTHGVGTLSTSTGGSHSHSYYDRMNSGTVQNHYTTSASQSGMSGSSTTDNGTTGSDGSHSHSISGSTATAGSGSSFSLLQPYVTVNYIIRVF